MRIFVPIPPETNNSGPSAQEEGKQTENDQQRQDSLPTNEVDEFLCIIKRSAVGVDQLNQTLSRISMLSLIM